MPAKSPFGKIKDVADVAVVSVLSAVSGTVKDPVGTGQKVVGQALGAAAAVASHVPGLNKPAPRHPEPVQKDEPEVAPVVPLQDKATKAHGDPVKPGTKQTAGKETAGNKTAAKTASKKTASKKTAPKKTAPKKTAAKKTAVEQAPTTDEPLIDPATAKAVRSETDVLRRGAERDPEG